MSDSLGSKGVGPDEFHGSDPRSDYNRGPYAPGGEPPLAFAPAGAPRRRGPAPVTLILSVLLLAVVGGGVFYLYRGGARAPGEAPQPVGTPLHEVRSAAPPQATTPDPAAGLSIYKDDAAPAAAAPAFVPPPEQPTPRPLAATPAPAPAAPLPSPVKAAAAPSPEPVKVVKPPKPKPPAPKMAKASEATKPPTDPDAKPTKLAKLTKPATATPAPAAVKTGPAVVQIGAFSSQSLADAGWNDAAGVAPGVMAGKSKKVASVTKADGTILYRTSIAGFASRDEAKALCEKLKAAGKSCFVR